MTRALLVAALLAGCGASATSDEEARPVKETSTTTSTSTSTTTEGAELVGTRPPEWTATTWFNTARAPLRLADLRGKVVLVRWFMSPGCPYCSATAPSLVALDQRYRDRGLVVVGMYHHKGKEPLDVEAVRGYVDHYGFGFPVGIDEGWADLRRWWLTRDRDFTSASYLVDREGVIRWVHRGGTYAPGDADHVALVGVIERLLDAGGAAADRLTVWVKRGEVVSRAGTGDAVQPGDGLGFAVTTTAPRHLVLIGRDAAGTLGVVFPDGGRAEEVAAGAETSLPGSVTLDGVLGTEEFFAFFCDRAVAVAEVTAAVARGGAPAVPGCTVDRVALEKRAR